MLRPPAALLIASLAANLVAATWVAWKLLRRRPALVATAYPAARASLFATLAGRRADVVLLGDSLTDWAEWDELLALPGVEVVNRGIAGDRTDDVLRRLESVAALRPRVVVLLVGANDLLGGRSVDDTAAGIERVVGELRRRLPDAALLLEGLLPVDPERAGPAVDNRTIDAVNARLRERAPALGAIYLAVDAALRDGRNRLDPALTPDGVHLLGEGYRRWADALRPALLAALARAR